MKIFDATQIKHWDKATIERENITSVKLMERAAKACASWIEHELLSKKTFKNSSIYIFCGPGNNGGDGLAIARLLLKKKKSVKVFVAQDDGHCSKDYQKNLSKLKSFTDVHKFNINDTGFPPLEDGSIVIDALFGTGLKRPLNDQYANAVKAINETAATVISIDIPSGMYTNESSKGNPVTRAEHTLSFQNYKLAFLMPENELNTGSIHLLNIGLDQNFERDEPAQWELLERGFISSLYHPRKLFSHKGNYGHALLVAGSYGKMGAAVLAAQGCLRSGTGLLTVHVPETGYEIIQTAAPEAMAITGTEVSFILYDAIGIGPGWGTGDASVKVLGSLFHFIKEKELPVKLLIDADALNILAANKNMLFMLPAGSILTPHPKEFARLFGESKDDFDRLQLARQKAGELNCYIILKGHYTAICTPGKQVYFNSTGNAGLATGGSGDVLTGIITGLAAQGYDVKDCCLLGVYLHGLAGELASRAFSMEAMIAGDIPKYLGDAYTALQQL